MMDAIESAPALPACFTAFPTLATSRLVLRQIGPSDAQDIYLYASDPLVQAFDVDPIATDVDQVRESISAGLEDYMAGRALGWGVTFRGIDRVIGGIAFYFQEHRYDVADLGYTLARPYWRQGLATEALREILRYGFEELRLHRVNVDTRMDNIASVRLVTKLGFKHEGVRRECIRSDDGTYQNWGLFGMLEQEYGDIVARRR